MCWVYRVLFLLLLQEQKRREKCESLCELDKLIIDLDSMQKTQETEWNRMQLVASSLALCFNHVQFGVFRN